MPAVDNARELPLLGVCRQKTPQQERFVLLRVYFANPRVTLAVLNSSNLTTRLPHPTIERSFGILAWPPSPQLPTPPQRLLRPTRASIAGLRASLRTPATSFAKRATRARACATCRAPPGCR